MTSIHNTQRRPSFERKHAKSKRSKTRQQDKHKLTGLSLYIRNHIRAVIAALEQLTQKPLATLLTLLVIGIALALPTALYVFMQNVQTIGTNWNNGNQVSLYLKPNIDKTQLDNLIKQIKILPEVANVRYVSPEEGLQEFKSQTQLNEVFALLDSNPLPGVLLVQANITAKSTTVLANLAEQLKNKMGVESVQVDMAWLKRLYAIALVGKYLIAILAGLLGVGVLLITGHTIHLATQTARQEINILQWIGATKTFIRRPFLYAGIFYGFLGGIIAWLLVAAALWEIDHPIKELTQLYGNYFVLQGITLKITLYLLMMSMALGLLGAWLAVSQHVWFARGPQQ
jgi:cell division transport system permease protein